jgi:calcineurin-like phosphoesterase family protein
MFEWCKDFAEINSNGKRITACHYALRVWNKSHHGSWHCYGHSHGTLLDDPYSNSIDVGIDCNKENPYHPFHFDDVAAHMNNKQWRQVDHHNRDTAQ